MELSAEIREAAQQLGRTLRKSESVQSYLQSAETFRQDAELAQLEADLMERYQSLSAREQAGEVLSPYEVNQYHVMLDRLRRSSLFSQRENHLRSVKYTFAQTAEAMNSVLSVDFTNLAE
jgi:cell fate (sporulation/competence/biofilm development) regulator YlbF (YheA/YmcA/DUF963 family)